MRFEFSTASRILFGQGAFEEAAGIAAGFGQRALVVTGRSAERATGLVKALAEGGVESRICAMEGEPSVDGVEQAVLAARPEGYEVVIGFGGGSALDGAKAIAALLANEGDVFDYLEVIGRGKALCGPSLPVIAIPTTAGTGAEVTRNAVLGVPDQGVKVSLRSAYLLPKVALVDPLLTLELPADITASTGMDALTQLIEPFVSNKANPLTDSLCREGLRRIARSLRRAWAHGGDASAREDMALASLFSGLALANAKLGAVHGFASVVGGRYPAPHGAVCARLLPLVMAANLRALRERQAGNAALERYAEIARLLLGDERASADDGVRWVSELAEELAIPGLARYGLALEDFPEILERTAVASSTQGNPVKLRSAELREILEKAL